MTNLDVLYDEVVDIINNHDDYHCRWCCDYSSTYRCETYISFDVHAWSDQGYGSEWTEYWCVYDDGRINRDGEMYNNLEEFKGDWT